MPNFWDNVTGWGRDRKNEAQREAQKYQNNINNWINETKPNISIAPFYNPKQEPTIVQFGSDKSPVQFGIELKPGKTVADTLPSPPNLTGSGTGTGNFIARIGGYGIEGNIGVGDPSDAKTAARFKLPFGFNLIYPDWDSPDRAIRDPNFRNKFGTDIIQNTKETLFPKGGVEKDTTIKGVEEKLKKERQEKIDKNPIGGFTVPKGVLKADTGVYAAVLNGKQGFLDKSDGKWYEFGALTPEQKARLASDFINDPKQLAKALPEGSYSRQGLYLPEFQPVRL